MIISSRSCVAVLVGLVVLVVLAVPPATFAQLPEDPPMPVGEIVETFLENPNAVPRAWVIWSCPETGTWPRDILDALVDRVEPSSTAGSSFARAQASSVAGQCGLEHLDAWFRRALLEPREIYTLRTVVQALWRSEVEENREALVDAMLDHPLGPEAEREVARALWTNSREPRLGGAGFVKLTAEVYRERGRIPDANIVGATFGQVGSEGEGLQAKRELLQAWRERPDGPDARHLLRMLVNDVSSTRRRTGDPGPGAWERAVAEVLEEVAEGRLEVPEEVRSQVGRMLERPHRPRTGPPR